MGKTTWTLELLERAKELWQANKLSATLIARELDDAVSRNAVIGQANRKGWGVRGLKRPAKSAPRVCKPRQPRTTPRPAAVRKPYAFPFKSSPKAKKMIQTISPVAVPEPVSKRLSILDLHDRHCRWMEGEGFTATYCGNEVEGNTSWCLHHLIRVDRRLAERTITASVKVAA